jgi:protein-tyrosine-phosphatase
MLGPHGEELPGAVLFACTMNAVRSPMAAALMEHLLGKFVRVESVGVRAGMPDPLAAAAMEEIGIALAAHQPRRFEDLQGHAFDLVITLSPEAQHKAVEMTRSSAAQIEYWRIADPTVVDGSREQRLAAYGAVRDDLLRRLKARFLARPGADT